MEHPTGDKTPNKIVANYILYAALGLLLHCYACIQGSAPIAGI